MRPKGNLNLTSDLENRTILDVSDKGQIERSKYRTTGRYLRLNRMGAPEHRREEKGTFYETSLESFREKKVVCSERTWYIYFHVRACVGGVLRLMREYKGRGRRSLNERNILQ